MTRTVLFALFIPGLLLANAGGNKVSAGKGNASLAKVSIPASQRDFCNLVWRCGLGIPPGQCPDSSALERTKLVYDSARCREARLLNARGVKPDAPFIGFRLYRFLGLEYRVIYSVEDEIPVSEARLAYLLGDLPLSAKLVSYFQETPYSAQYADSERKEFKGSKGKRLRGEARLISGSTSEKRLFYFGTGVAEVALWTLKGPALLDFSYWPTGHGKVRYKMNILVFPGNGVINGIMNLSLFRKVVRAKIQGVLTDITETARKIAISGNSGFQNAKLWSPEERKKIETFLKLP